MSIIIKKVSFKEKMWTILLLLSVSVSVSGRSLTCDPQYYLAENRFCLKCDFGFFVKEDCKTPGNFPTCEKCGAGTFMNVSEGLKECFNCKQCNSDLGLKTAVQCKPPWDTTCEPLDGFFWIHGSDKHCEAAQEHSRCKPGQYIKKYGTAATDTECSDCTSGTFSNGSFTSCQPHTHCESKNIYTGIPGTLSADARCLEVISIVEIVVVSLIALCLLTGFIIALIVWRKEIWNEEDNPEDEAVLTNPQMYSIQMSAIIVQ